MTAVWNVRRDEERQRWQLVPLVSVGPLRFGMMPDEVAAALDYAVATAGVGTPSSTTQQHYSRVGVTAYYQDTRLYCVAVDALNGPQVTLDGQTLVGQVPSALERWMHQQAEEHGRELRYTHAADPELVDLGLIARAQRAGDVVLSRPVMLDQRAEVTWDYVPSGEWMVF